VLALVLIATALFLEAPRFLENLPAGRQECSGSPQIPGDGAIMGSDGCFLTGVVHTTQQGCAGSPDVPAAGAIMGPDGCLIAGTVGTNSEDPLAFPQQVVNVPPPAEEPVAPAEAVAGQATSPQATSPQARVGQGSQTAPASSPANESLHHPKAVELSRRLGVPLPDIRGNGTFEGDGSAEPVGDQPAAGSGAPTSVQVAGAANGSNPAPGAPLAPAAPPVGQGGAGDTEPGSPGLPPN
jgi:hypothetical protein